MQPLPAQPQILLAESEGGFSVTVSPSQYVGHDQDFPDYISARTHARRLRFACGWVMIDRVDPKTRGAAEEAEQRRIEEKRGRLSIVGGQ